MGGGGGVGGVGGWVGGEISKRNLAVVVWRLNFPGETRGQRSVQELGPEASPRAADGQIGSDWFPSPLVKAYLRPFGTVSNLFSQGRFWFQNAHLSSEGRSVQAEYALLRRVERASAARGAGRPIRVW